MITIEEDLKEWDNLINLATRGGSSTTTPRTVTVIEDFIDYGDDIILQL